MRRTRTPAERLSASPILARERLVRARSWAMPASISLFVTAVGAFALVLFWIAISRAPDRWPNPLDMVNVAFLTAVLQLAIVALAAPAMAASGIAGERERGTLDTLLLGRYGPRRLVLAELAGALSLLGLLLVMALPVLLAVFLYAGLGIGQLLLTELVTVATVVAVGAVALASGARLGGTLPAALAGYAGLLVLCVATVLLGILLRPEVGASPPVHPVVFANPLYALHALAFAEPARWGPALRPWQVAVGVELAVVAVAVLAAAAVLRRR